MTSARQLTLNERSPLPLTKSTQQQPTHHTWSILFCLEGFGSKV